MRPPAWVWLLAFLPRLAVFAYVAAQPLRGLIYADSLHYASVAQNLALRGSFGSKLGEWDEDRRPKRDAAELRAWLDGNLGPPFHFDRYRTPGYPLLLAPWFKVMDSPVVPLALLQTVAGVLTVLLCWHWGGMLGGPRGAAWAAVFAALEPAGVIHTPLLLSDTFGAALLLLATFLFWKLLQDPSDRALSAAGSGLVYGIGIMVRPVTLYLPVLLAGLLLRRKKALAVFLLAAYLLPGLWVARNSRYGRPVFCCISGWTFAEIPAEAGMIKGPSTQAELVALTCPERPSGDSPLRLFLRCAATRPVFVGKILAKRFFYLFEGTSLDMLVDMMRVGAPPMAASSAPPRRFQFQRDHPALVPLWIGGLALLLGLYAAALKGCWRLFQAGRLAELLLLGACVLYLVAATLPLGGCGRYRIPLVPLLAVAAGAAYMKEKKQ
ncbi:MAG: glycosyltransferase family 39 protein [Elusimicrobia bacterium]|nr:glycosyltransferase family 39 protein [Elusimicrobiota bacterium]